MSTKPRKLVHIEWVNPEYDWPYFWMEESELSGMFKLTGADDPDGSAKHDGDTFYVNPSEIRKLKVLL